MSNSSLNRSHKLKTLKQTVNQSKNRTIGESVSEPVFSGIKVNHEDLKALEKTPQTEAECKSHEAHSFSFDFSIFRGLKGGLKKQLTTHQEIMSKFLALILTVMVLGSPLILFVPTAQAKSSQAPVTYQTQSQAGVTVTFDRSLSGDRTGQHKAPPLTNVTMEITATVDNQVENATLIDYYPTSWTVTDENGGTTSTYNENYDKIEWDVGTVTDSVTKTYVIKSPQRTIPPTDYYFHSKLTHNNGSGTSDDWRVKVADPTELLTNPGFETAGSGGDTDAENWTQTGDMNRETYAARSGSYGMTIDRYGSSTTSEAYQEVNVSGGNTYEFSIYIRNEDTTPVGTYYLKLSWYDGGTLISGENASKNVSFSTTWVEKTLSDTAPSNADTARVTFGATNAADDDAYTYFDDASLVVTGVANVAPNPPENLVSENITTSSADLGLDVSDNDGDDIDYVEFYDASDDSLIDNVTTTKSSPASYSTTWGDDETDLSPGTQYSWYAKASDNNGNVSNASITDTFYTASYDWFVDTQNEWNYYENVKENVVYDGGCCNSHRRVTIPLRMAI